MTAIAIDKLTTEEKIDLIERLVDSLDPADLPLPDGHREELERRLITLDVDIANSISWEEFDRTLRQRFG
ncbi:addiction module protein [Niveispirillum sp. KHB5.9]|uniref:addiction module protein n=1 Tax=Niveispirillum sp. KHB5.9 TaxID=3400269 RepID=UPI003A87394A